MGITDTCYLPGDQCPNRIGQPMHNNIPPHDPQHGPADEQGRPSSLRCPCPLPDGFTIVRLRESEGYAIRCNGLKAAQHRAACHMAAEPPSEG